MSSRKLIVMMTIFACGILVGFATMLIFVYGALAVWRGFPMLYRVWRLQPNSRLTLVVVGLGIVGAAALGSVAAWTYWVRMLRVRGLFDSSQAPQLPAWLLDYAKLGVFLSPLFGLAFASAIVIPLGLLYLGEEPHRLFRDLRNARATVAVAAAPGALIGFPTRLLLGRVTRDASGR